MSTVIEARRVVLEMEELLAVMGVQLGLLQWMWVATLSGLRNAQDVSLQASLPTVLGARRQLASTIACYTVRSSWCSQSRRGLTWSSLLKAVQSVSILPTLQTGVSTRTRIIISVESMAVHPITIPCFMVARMFMLLV